MQAKVGRELPRGRSDLPNDIHANGRIGTPVASGPRKSLPSATQGHDALPWFKLAGQIERLVEPLPRVGSHPLFILRPNSPLLRQALGIDLSNRWMLGDLPIHDGLRKGGIIGLVMPMSAVTPQVNHYIDFEF